MLRIVVVVSRITIRQVEHLAISVTSLSHRSGLLNNVEHFTAAVARGVLLGRPGPHARSGLVLRPESAILGEERANGAFVALRKFLPAPGDSRRRRVFRGKARSAHDDRCGTACILLGDLLRRRGAPTAGLQRLLEHRVFVLRVRQHAVHHPLIPLRGCLGHSGGQARLRTWRAVVAIVLLVEELPKRTGVALREASCLGPGARKPLAVRGFLFGMICEGRKEISTDVLLKGTV